MLERHAMATPSGSFSTLLGFVVQSLCPVSQWHNNIGRVVGHAASVSEVVRWNKDDKDVCRLSVRLSAVAACQPAGQWMCVRTLTKNQYDHYTSRTMNMLTHSTQRFHAATTCRLFHSFTSSFRLNLSKKLTPKLLADSLQLLIRLIIRVKVVAKAVKSTQYLADSTT